QPLIIWLSFLSEAPSGSLRMGDPPNCVCQVVRDNQCTARVKSNSNRAAAGFAILCAKTCHEIHRRPGGAAVAEGYENHFVTSRILAVPAAVFADECAFGKLAAHDSAGKVQAECGDVRTQAVVRRDCGGDLFR